jgi:hypothetical protein
MGNSRWKGARLVPSMDDFLFLPTAILHLRDRVASLLDRLRLERNVATPIKAIGSLHKSASTTAS